MPVKCPWVFFSIWKKFVHGITLVKFPNIQFQENPSSESRDVPYGERDRQTDVTKLTVVFSIVRRHLKTEIDIMALPTRGSR
jgi:hypothetical protein